jgi:hypothetical protein
MTEKIILKETVNTGKPVVENKPKKRNYKPRKKKEEEFTGNINKLVAEPKELKIPKMVGKYCMGSGKGFCIHLEKKPNWLHRKCMGLFLGWKWNDNTNK